MSLLHDEVVECLIMNFKTWKHTIEVLADDQCKELIKECAKIMSASSCILCFYSMKCLLWWILRNNGPRLLSWKAYWVLLCPCDRSLCFIGQWSAKNSGTRRTIIWIYIYDPGLESHVQSSLPESGNHGIYRLFYGRPTNKSDIILRPYSRMISKLRPCRKLSQAYINHMQKSNKTFAIAVKHFRASRSSWVD